MDVRDLRIKILVIQLLCKVSLNVVAIRIDEKKSFINF